MAENLFTKYKDFRPADYLKEKTDYSDKVYMDTQAKLEELKGAPFKELQLNQREKDTNQLISGFETLGMSPMKATSLARDLIGRPDLTDGIESTGLLDFTPYAPLVYYLPEEIENFKRAREQGSVGGQVLSGAMIGLDLASVLPFGFLATRGGKKLKSFADSLKNKIRPNQETPQIGAFSSILDDKTVPTMLPSTKRASPNLAMVNPRVLDEFGFFYKSEELANKMKQNKGSGADFDNYFKGQGITETELFNTGLEELFKSDTVTKKEIQDTIKANKLQLYEKTYQSDGITEGSNLIFEDITKKIDTPPSYLKFSKNEIDFNLGARNREDNYPGDAIIAEYEKMIPTEVLEDTKTGYKITYDPQGEYYLTFKKGKDINDIKQSEQAINLMDMGDDVDDMRFNEIAGKGNKNEAILQTESYAIRNGDLEPTNTRFSDLTQLGGSNYREFVLGRQSFDPELAARGEFSVKSDFKQDAHFPDYNPIVHIRTKDRTLDDGSKTLYVEEMQSDRGQAGRKKGFREGSRSYAKLEQKMKGYNKELLDNFANTEIKLKAPEQELLYQLKNPNRPPIRVPLREDTSLLMAEKYNQGATVPDIVYDYENSRMPNEYKTLKLSEYIELLSDPNYPLKGEIGTYNLMRNVNALALQNLDTMPKGINYELLPEEQKLNLLRSSLQDISYNRYYLGNRFDDLDTFAGYADELRNNITETGNLMRSNIPGGDLVEKTEDWTKAGIKRLLQRAVKEGHDSVSFSPGQVQVDRWGNDGLYQHYDVMIPKMAEKVAGKANVSRRKVEIKPDKKYIVTEEATQDMFDPIFMVREEGNEFKMPVASFTSREAAENNAEVRNSTQLQESVTITITPELKDKILKGLSLFTVGGGTALGLQEQIGALGNMPSTQANLT